MQACRTTTDELEGTTVQVQRLVTAGPDGPDGPVAVDVVARYTHADGGVSVVSSCDVYEFARAAS